MILVPHRLSRSLAMFFLCFAWIGVALAAPDSSSPRHERTITSGTVTLAATIELPESPTGMVLWLPGSGPVTRETKGAAVELRSAVRAYCLAHRLGFCVFDKRGTGRSTGDFATNDLNSLTADAAAVLTDLTTFRVGAGLDLPLSVAGHSEGCLIISRLLEREEPRFTSALLFAPPILPGQRFFLSEQNSLARTRKYTPEQLAAYEAYVAEAASIIAVEDNNTLATFKIAEAYRRHTEGLFENGAFTQIRLAQQITQFVAPWNRSLLRGNPLPAVLKGKVPTVMIFSRHDLLVPLAEQLAYLAEVGGVKSRNVEHLIVDAQDHFFMGTPAQKAGVAAVIQAAFVQCQRKLSAAGGAQ
jgi:pimeloyl-ACP methyl ester carboxylesterase